MLYCDVCVNCDAVYSGICECSVSLGGHLVSRDVMYFGVSAMLYCDICGSGHVVNGDVLYLCIWYFSAVVLFGRGETV
jgi:predicted RNA-binding protein